MGKENSILARRLIQSYMSSIISISLVLLLVGLVVFFGVNAKSVSDYFKENIRVTAVLSDGADEAAANKLMMSIFKKDYVSDIEYISKEQGTLEMERMLGKDFLDVFETNPVPISLEIFLKADYFRPDSLAAVKVSWGVRMITMLCSSAFLISSSGTSAFWQITRQLASMSTAQAWDS